LSDNNPDHFALRSDKDWVLIKEWGRGTKTINGGGNSATITHDLGYIPMYAVYANNQWVHGYNIYADYRVYVTTTTLVMINNSASQQTFRWYLFYDQQK